MAEHQSVRSRCLVTGAGGFIGSHLVERLVRAGASVRAFVHYNARNDWGSLELIDPSIMREVEVVTGDISDPFSVRSAVAWNRRRLPSIFAHRDSVLLRGAAQLRNDECPRRNQRDASGARRERTSASSIRRPASATEPPGMFPSTRCIRCRDNRRTRRARSEPT